MNSECTDIITITTTNSATISRLPSAALSFVQQHKRNGRNVLLFGELVLYPVPTRTSGCEIAHEDRGVCRTRNVHKAKRTGASSGAVDGLGLYCFPITYHY